MTDKGPPSVGTDPTILAGEDLGMAETNVSSEATTQQHATGKLPAS